MESLIPTLFYEIYRKHFGVAYGVSQESTWHWLTNEHICDFFTPTYTKDDELMAEHLAHVSCGARGSPAENVFVDD